MFVHRYHRIFSKIEKIFQKIQRSKKTAFPAFEKNRMKTIRKTCTFLIQRDTQRQSPSTANYYPPPSPCMLLQYCSVIMPNISRSTIWPSNGYKSNRSKLGDTGPLPFSHNVYTHVYTHVHTCIQRPIVVALPLSLRKNNNNNERENTEN